MTVRDWLNSNTGPLMAAAVVAIATQSVVSYGNSERVREQILNLQDFAKQQQQMNDASIKVSEAVAVIATRMEYFEKDLDRVFANMPATNKPN